MKASELAERIGAEILTRRRDDDVDIGRVYAGDRMSDLLREVSEGTLLVTNLGTDGLVRLVDLMEAPGICLVSGAGASEALLAAAEEHGAVVMVSPGSLFETCGRLYEELEGGGRRNG